MSLEAWGDDDEYMRSPDGYVTEEHAQEMVREAVESITHSMALLVEARTEERDALLKDLRKCEQQFADECATSAHLEELCELAFEKAALQCDHEANVQATYANEAGTPGLRLIHSTASNTLMAVAQRIRALKGA